jgi:hypothetical protein
MDTIENQTFIENRTFDEIQIGESASLARTLTREDIEHFAVMSGDINPAHVDEEYAKSDMFHKIIAHGMWGASLISTVLGTKLPGPGAIYLGQTLHFLHPVTVGPGSSAPQRVPIGKPSRAVKPIEVATLRRPRSAHMLAPPPRWAITTRPSALTPA